MSVQYNRYNAWFRHHVVKDYQPGVRGHGAKAVAAKYRLPHHSLVLRWAEKKGEPIEAFEHKPGAGRKRKLPMEDVNEHVKDFIVAKNQEGKAVSYEDVRKEVQKRTRISVSGATVRRWGHNDCNITDKLTTRKLAIEGSNA